MITTIYDAISYYFFVIIYFFYYLLKGNSEDEENNGYKKKHEPYYNKLNNINKEYSSNEYYDNNNKYFNSQPNHYHSMSDKVDYNKNTGYLKKLYNVMGKLYLNLKYYIIKFCQGCFYGVKYLCSILYTPFSYLFDAIFYIIKIIVAAIIHVISTIWNFFFGKRKSIEGDEIGLRKKTDAVSEDIIVEEDKIDKQLPEERWIKRDNIKECEYGSIANTTEEPLKNCNKNKYEEGNIKSFQNPEIYPEDEGLLTQNINSDICNKTNETVMNKGNPYNVKGTENNTPPTPPPPLDDKFLKEFYKKDKLPETPSPQPTINEQPVRSHSSCSYTNTHEKNESNETGDWTTTRNVIIIDTNKNEKLDDNHFIFNNVTPRSQSKPPINPVSSDFFIGNSVFKPIADMEIYKNEFNRKTEDKWYDSKTSSNVPNNRNIREGTNFDANIHGSELKNKNYYVTTPSERNTPAFGTSTSFSNIRSVFDSSDSPTKLATNTINYMHNNIGNINENPTLMSCKRTFERRVIQRSYNQDSQGHLHKDWEVESFQAIKNEMPVSYNFYTRSAYK
uniref:SH3 domain-containing protein n=1 Tax=Parastrongyloides trichosuri TaxID=131310 RepID=A0A0N5A415_PARTI